VPSGGPFPYPYLRGPKLRRNVKHTVRRLCYAERQMKERKKEKNMYNYGWAILDRLFPFLFFVGLLLEGDGGKHNVGGMRGG
jgi:hypothetical protein